jgi:hypothetical protein
MTGRRKRELYSPHWISCQVPHTHFMLRPSQTPLPQVVQGAAHAVPARGRAVGQPAAAGALQLTSPFGAQ